ncbi:MBOAT family O-acyltransferase [Paenibacillus mucilaginosus]|uniref:Membrane bound O-acyl transferase MBOAT family protein n=2 Tax=Paenibacillus mucilaginosus TaxID=61624 RepID=H6NTH9_9BACL|nr:MBOAT family O-acyltransferase [Paenibacillus mucilaginosus]AEI38802.1 membrane bound O-acyl transferase MBOAT family protein [Paenibacillus mucilaginosus KNP414]AFC27126.1 membrane bound O-acyl transferase MBOAT family protein [Paenibacillus mucilaginosus 3016]MCG7215934.1 MBOAT family protein [Paenibacillus mucilaginosus]WDM27879.1 MBOAT family protein [Paenibacillus mucilaginosus]WFA16060.1 MBOAT family protein [Paenibacillus mucilaginosus]
MFYLNMNAVLAMLGMVIVLALTRKWRGNKRLLLLAFNLSFLVVFSSKLFFFYLGYTALNYLAFRFLSVVTRARLAWFIGLIALNIGLVSSLRLFDMKIFTGTWYDAALVIGLIYNVLKVIDALYFAYFFKQDAKAHVLDYFNYILFLPTFTSGPILKFRDFMADAKQPYQVDAAQAEVNIKRIILGLFKRVVLVTWASTLFDYVSEGELQTHESLFLMIVFYAWIYFDFSGYSDIAVGFGRLMGYNVPENFKKPFSSPTLTQYWRNWHATLGDWFRDHIFIFFSRQTPTKWTAAGLSVLIMVLIGLWHGFSWLYLLWGIYHGLFIALENLLGRTTVNKRKVSKTHFYARCALTQLIVTLAIIVYSPNEEAVLRIYRGLLNLPW